MQPLPQKRRAIPHMTLIFSLTRSLAKKPAHDFGVVCKERRTASVLVGETLISKVGRRLHVEHDQAVDRILGQSVVSITFP